MVADIGIDLAPLRDTGNAVIHTHLAQKCFNIIILHS
jgi:hypothetical protein